MILNMNIVLLAIETEFHGSMNSKLRGTLTRKARSVAYHKMTFEQFEAFGANMLLSTKGREAFDRVCVALKTSMDTLLGSNQTSCP